jgi:hypothetical protein
MPGTLPGSPSGTPGPEPWDHDAMRRRARRTAERRAMYAGGTPGDAARAIHRRFAAGPIPRVVPVACVLEVRGRRSGRTIPVPLVIVRWKGDWYVASMLGDEVNWVRNVRADSGRATLLHGRRRPVRLTEIPPDRRAPILKRYLLFAVGARPHVRVAWRAPLGEFERIAPDHPVFRVDRA